MQEKWPAIRFGGSKVETNGSHYEFAVEVNLNTIGPGSVRVELYANGVNGSETIRQLMTPDRVLTPTGHVVYRATVSAARASSVYCARIMPHQDGISVPLEMNAIHWEK